MRWMKRAPFTSYGVVVLVLHWGLSFYDYDHGGVITILYLTAGIWGWFYWIIAECLPSGLPTPLAYGISILGGFGLCGLGDVALNRYRKWRKATNP
jgi:hypothetical protein